MKTIKIAAIIVLLIGVVGLGIGGAFVGIGWAKNNQVSTYLKAEKVTLGLSAADIAKGDVVDSLSAAENAATFLTKDRQTIAPTYNDLLGGKKFDPTNLTELSYAQAMNLQNSIYSAVLAFGLAESIMADGAFMIAVGISFIIIGIVFYNLAKKIT
jgi:acyl CoA:acetate/3-ketoacid CoA transferase beta subunit